jgi:hypothetical protein
LYHVNTARLRRGARWALLALAPVLAFLVYRGHTRSVHAVVSVEETVLAQQTAALQALVEDADRGELLNFRHVLVVVDQGLVRDLLRAAMPLEGLVGGFQVRIDTAEASFEDGLALIHLSGKATHLQSSMAADLRVYGALEVGSMDPASGLLRCEVRVFGVEADRADVLGIDEPLRGLAETLSHGGLAALLRFLEIPVRIDDHLTLPAVSSKRLRIRAAEVPIRAEVADVKVFGGKLWVALAEQPPAPLQTASAAQQAGP